MTLTMQLLDWLVRNDMETVKIQGWTPDFSFTDVLFWDGKEPVPNVLYLKSHTLKDPNMELDSYQAFHVIEESIVPLLNNQSGVYVSCPDGDVPVTLNKIFHTINHFNKWYNDTLFLSSKAMHPQCFIDIWDTYFVIPLAIVDQSFMIVGQSSNTKKVFSNFDGNSWGHRMDFEEIQELLVNDPHFEETYTERGLCRYTKVIDAKRKTYYYNIFHKSKFAARLLMYVPAADDTDGIEILLREAGTLISDAYIRYIESQFIPTKNNSLNENIYKLLNGKQVPATEMALAAQDYSWILEHEYQLLYLVPQNSGSAINLDYLCEKIQTAFPSVIAVQTGDSISVIRNLNVENKNSDFSTNLPIFLRDSLCRAGISKNFIGLYNAPKYYKGAKDAFYLGIKKWPDQWFYRFSDLTREFILMKATELYPASDLLNPAVINLRQYDKKHMGSELEKSLYIYLKLDGNSTAAAEALRIHRTTFLYRMSKIDKLIHMDLTDWDTKLALMLSYTLNPISNETNDL